MAAKHTILSQFQTERRRKSDQSSIFVFDFDGIFTMKMVWRYQFDRKFSSVNYQMEFTLNFNRLIRRSASTLILLVFFLINILQLCGSNPLKNVPYCFLLRNTHESMGQFLYEIPKNETHSYPFLHVLFAYTFSMSEFREKHGFLLIKNNIFWQ